MATLEALARQHEDALIIRAGVRSEAKAEALKTQFPQIETVLLDLDQPATLPAAFQRVDKWQHREP